MKQHLSDSLWVDRRSRRPRANGSTGSPAREHRSRRGRHARDDRTGLRQSRRGSSLAPRAILAEIDDALATRVLGELPPGRAMSFEDQYISSAGQLYELMMGHDRWMADLQPARLGDTRTARALLPPVRSRARRESRPRPASLSPTATRRPVRRAARRRDRRRLDRLRQRGHPRASRARAAAAPRGIRVVTSARSWTHCARTATSSTPITPSSSRARRAGSI